MLSKLQKQGGFTLVETIVGIVLLGISFAIISSLILPATQQTADILHQVRAAELAQSLLNEIQNKAFDERSDKTGGRVRCGESGVTCTDDDKLGPENGAGGRDNDGEDERKKYDDVDDYHNLSYAASSIIDSQDQAIDYTGYSLAVTIGNDSDYNGVTIAQGDTDDNIYTAKLITVKVTTPIGGVLTFSTYRANF